jgi:hypothetical protein
LLKPVIGFVQKSNAKWFPSRGKSLGTPRSHRRTR